MKECKKQITVKLSEDEIRRAEQIAKGAGFKNVGEMKETLITSFLNYMDALEKGDIEYLNSVPVELERLFEEVRAECKRKRIKK